MKEQPLDDEGLTTLICEVESVVNGCSIMKSSDDSLDSEALMLNHLLLLESDPRLRLACSGKRMATPEEDGARFSI